MPKLPLKEQLILANNRALQLQEQLDCTNKNYNELNTRYLKQLETNGELLKMLIIIRDYLDKAAPIHRKILKILDKKLEKE